MPCTSSFLTRRDGCIVTDNFRCPPGFAGFQQPQRMLPTLALRTSTDGCIVTDGIRCCPCIAVFQQFQVSKGKGFLRERLPGKDFIHWRHCEHQSRYWAILASKGKTLIDDYSAWYLGRRQLERYGKLYVVDQWMDYIAERQTALYIMENIQEQGQQNVKASSEVILCWETKS